MKTRYRTSLAFDLVTAAAVAAFAMSVAGCDPIPRRTLSTDEKIADMYWIYSQFGENYAPLDYKQKRFNFEYDALKTKYLEEAKKTTTNDEFYALMMKFVSEFKDAHTSAALANGSLPDRARVAFLGFSGVRTEDSLLVKSVLPTNSAKSHYPVKVNDLILEINGKKLKEVVDAELVQYRDLGFAEANYTYHFNKIFNRISTTNGLPKETEAVLTVKRADKTLKITLPWVVKDLVTFQQEQVRAAKPSPSPSPASTEAEEQNPSSGNFLMLADDLKSPIMKFSFIGFDGRVELPIDNIRKVTQGLMRKVTDSFKFMDQYAEWQMLTGETLATERAPLDRLAEMRTVLADAIYVSGSKTYPAYVAPVDVVDKDDKKTGEKKLVGYVYIDTFSPGDSEENVVKEFKNTLAVFKNLGVRDIIIDTINNGGGSLSLGMHLAQALTPEKIEQPLMQFRLSDTWLDRFQAAALEGADEATKEYARRVYIDLVAAKQAGGRLSQPYSAEVLYRYQILPNADIEKPFRVKLLINEMCASMCDMFAGIIQDNNLGEVVGTRSMGAGGNVVNHTQAPNSHLDVRQTESLMVRATREGATEDTTLGGVRYTYVENNGVTPDVPVEVVKYVKEKYSTVIKKAVDLIVKKVEPTAPKVE